MATNKDICKQYTHLDHKIGGNSGEAFIDTFDFPGTWIEIPLKAHATTAAYSRQI